MSPLRRYVGGEEISLTKLVDLFLQISRLSDFSRRFTAINLAFHSSFSKKKSEIYRFLESFLKKMQLFSV